MNMFIFSILLLLNNGDVHSKDCVVVTSTFKSELVHGAFKILAKELAGLALQVQIT